MLKRETHMNNGIYTKNLNALRKSNEKLADILEKNEYECLEGIEVYSEQALTGDTIFKVKNKESLLYIDGKYDPRSAMEKWFSEQKKFEYESIIFVIGFGNAMYLKRLIKETKKSAIIVVYEPCINIFIKAMKEIDLVELFEDRPLVLVIDGINHEELKPIMDKIIDFDKMSLIHNLILGNYAKLFPEQVKKFLEIEKKRTQMVIRTCGTVVRFTDVNGENVLNNIAYLYDNYTTFQLRNMLPENIPSIIVSAGPSLNKNLLDLKLAKGKACIIATDTAIKPLLNNGIIPDFMVIVDGKKPGHLFEHSLISRVPMVMSSVVSKDPVNMHKGKKYFAWDGTIYERDLLKVGNINSNQPEKIDISSLLTGGSVANTAFSFARQLGSKTIILIGQDLAFTGNKTHADGTFQEKMDEIDTSEGKYLEVEDIYGNMVLTRSDFKAYLDWFDEQIEQLQDIKVIDATEGGARIKGTEVLTLKEAIQRECIVEINVKELLDDIPPIFVEEKVREKVKEYYHNTPKRFMEVKKKAKQGINHYDKLIKLSKNNNYSDKEFLTLTKKIKRINEFLDNDGVALIVIDSLRDLDYSIRSSIYVTEKNDNEERVMIAKQGKLLLEGMVNCIDRLYDIAQETVGKVGNV